MEIIYSRVIFCAFAGYHSNKQARISEPQLGKSRQGRVGSQARVDAEAQQSRFATRLFSPPLYDLSTSIKFINTYFMFQVLPMSTDQTELFFS